MIHQFIKEFRQVSELVNCLNNQYKNELEKYKKNNINFESICSSYERSSFLYKLYYRNFKDDKISHKVALLRLSKLASDLADAIKIIDAAEAQLIKNDTVNFNDYISMYKAIRTYDLHLHSFDDIREKLRDKKQLEMSIRRNMYFLIQNSFSFFGQTSIRLTFISGLETKVHTNMFRFSTICNKLSKALIKEKEKIRLAFNNYIDEISPAPCPQADIDPDEEKEPAGVESNKKFNGIFSSEDSTQNNLTARI